MGQWWWGEVIKKSANFSVMKIKQVMFSGRIESLQEVLECDSRQDDRFRPLVYPRGLLTLCSPQGLVIRPFVSREGMMGLRSGIAPLS